MKLLSCSSSSKGTKILTSIVSELNFQNNGYARSGTPNEVTFLSSIADLNAHIGISRFDGVLIYLGEDQEDLAECIKHTPHLLKQPKVLYLGFTKPSEQDLQQLEELGHLWISCSVPLGSLIRSIQQYLDMPQSQGESPETYGFLRLTVGQMYVLECLLAEVSDEAIAATIGYSPDEINLAIAQAMLVFGVHSRADLIKRYNMQRMTLQDRKSHLR